MVTQILAMRKALQSRKCKETNDAAALPQPLVRSTSVRNVSTRKIKRSFIADTTASKDSSPKLGKKSLRSNSSSSINADSETQPAFFGNYLDESDLMKTELEILCQILEDLVHIMCTGKIKKQRPHADEMQQQQKVEDSSYLTVTPKRKHSSGTKVIQPVKNKKMSSSFVKSSFISPMRIEEVRSSKDGLGLSIISIVQKKDMSVNRHSQLSDNTSDIADTYCGTWTPMNQSQMLKAAKWTPNNEKKECNVCHLTFTVIRRRHHCRQCGELVCHSCSDKTDFVSGYQDKKVRVCISCYTTNVIARRVVKSRRQN